ncbi:Phenylalanyl-tRNA synthetase beta chain [hydrothermal vent metagenome]|uniref:Phenylalanine--tRNA ligase beta subunit n=1 Tax=hydrothermal vent metagenome TaxID=652676 RepID=A0A1W1CBB9_9ZZZZ
MIVTRGWLSEFIDLEDISDERLYEIFNSIGLEVDSIKKIDIPSKVVVGKIISCEKHPDADKLNVCQIDVGGSTRQIVCGAANVVDAEFVAVAMIGATLPGDFEIKFATLRGVDSEGMVCASSEIGLPDMGKGIMILDDSIGELEIGRELCSYDRVADTIIELELTANRGDCLSIHGVARDLSVALNRELKNIEYRETPTEKLGIARVADIRTSGDIDANLCYKLAIVEDLKASLLINLRLSMVGVELGSIVSNILNYSIHATGVISRAYDANNIQGDNDKILLQVVSKERGIVSVKSNEHILSIVGVNQSEVALPDSSSTMLLLESSYIDPDLLVEAVSQKDIEKDDLYYKTSRGSEPDLKFGMSYLSDLLGADASYRCYDGHLSVESKWEPTHISVDSKEICSIIGQDIEFNRIVTILKNLQFDLKGREDSRFSVAVPRFRHDIKNIQDITEEIVRIVGINNIDSKRLSFEESNRLTDTTDRYLFKKSLRNRAVSAGLYENVSYLFSHRDTLKRYEFELVDEKLDLANPIAEDLNTLRTTIFPNLMDAAKRNVNYNQKSIGLFEIGAIFDSNREQKEVLSILFSGEDSTESILNSGKPDMVDFGLFVKKLGSIVGEFDLVKCSESNGLIHPYQSADIIYRGQRCGYLTKLHPVVQEEYGIPDTFMAQIDMESLLPIHIDVVPISKFQGVYKDLSIVVDSSLPYTKVDREIASLELDILRKWYPVDIYSDESLGDKQSLTIRFYIQSMDKTLQDSDIDETISAIMDRLEKSCQATLR